MDAKRDSEKERISLFELLSSSFFYTTFLSNLLVFLVVFLVFVLIGTIEQSRNLIVLWDSVLECFGLLSVSFYLVLGILVLFILAVLYWLYLYLHFIFPEKISFNEIKKLFSLKKIKVLFSKINFKSLIKILTIKSPFCFFIRFLWFSLFFWIFGIGLNNWSFSFHLILFFVFLFPYGWMLIESIMRVGLRRKETFLLFLSFLLVALFPMIKGSIFLAFIFVSLIMFSLVDYFNKVRINFLLWLILVSLILATFTFGLNFINSYMYNYNNLEGFSLINSTQGYLLICTPTLTKFITKNSLVICSLINRNDASLVPTIENFSITYYQLNGSKFVDKSSYKSFKNNSIKFVPPEEDVYKMEFNISLRGSNNVSSVVFRYMVPKLKESTNTNLFYSQDDVNENLRNATIYLFLLISITLISIPTGVKSIYEIYEKSNKTKDGKKDNKSSKNSVKKNK